METGGSDYRSLYNFTPAIRHSAERFRLKRGCLLSPDLQTGPASLIRFSEHFSGVLTDSSREQLGQSMVAASASS